MTTKIKNIISYLFLFIISCVKLFISSIFAAFKVKDAITNGAVWFSIFYQPFLILILMAYFAKKIDSIIYTFINGQGDWEYTIILSLIIIVIILFANAIIELFFRIKFSDEFFVEMFSLQQHAHNYMMAIISLTAIYAAIDTSSADELNTMLLVFGILIFACIAITDLYKALFINQNIVKDIYLEFQENYTKYKK